MALGNSFVGLLVVSFSLNRWCRRKRSTAIGLAVVGFAAASALAMLVQTAVVVHQFLYFEQILDCETAALVLSELNLFTIAGRIIGGMLGDRMPINRLMTFNMVCATVA